MTISKVIETAPRSSSHITFLTNAYNIRYRNFTVMLSKYLLLSCDIGSRKNGAYTCFNDTMFGVTAKNGCLNDKCCSWNVHEFGFQNTLETLYRILFCFFYILCLCGFDVFNVVSILCQ